MKNAKVIFRAAILVCSLFYLLVSCKKDLQCTVNIVNNSNYEVYGQLDVVDFDVQSGAAVDYVVDLSGESEDIWVWLVFKNSGIADSDIGRNETLEAGKTYTWSISGPFSESLE